MKSKLKYINKLEQKINYNFNDKGLLEEALTHSSFKSKSNSNQERLEFLGDRVLGLVIACLLYTSPSPRDRTRSRMPSSA